MLMENCPNADLEVCFYDGEWTACVCGPAATNTIVNVRRLSTRRSEDTQDVGAGARGGEEREVVHGEGRGGAERPEPREQAVRGAVWWGPQHVSGSGGRHHSGGAAQHQERPFLPHHHRQVGKCRYWRWLIISFSLCFIWRVFFVPLQEAGQSELPVPAIPFAAPWDSFASPGATNHSFSKSHLCSVSRL